jgi:hypothetical protein
MVEEDEVFDAKKYEKLNAVQTKFVKTMIPLNQRVVLVVTSYDGSPRYTGNEEGRYRINRTPIFGIVHWADEEGVSYYRYLIDGVGCEMGITPGELDWDGLECMQLTGGLLFPDIESPEDIASKMKWWKEHAKQSWEQEHENGR